jgi:hypothetical protein
MSETLRADFGDLDALNHQTFPAHDAALEQLLAAAPSWMVTKLQNLDGRFVEAILRAAVAPVPAQDTAHDLASFAERLTAWYNSADEDEMHWQTVVDVIGEMRRAAGLSLRQARKGDPRAVVREIAAGAASATAGDPDNKRRDELARILAMVAADGFPGPRDLDGALDAIEQLFTRSEIAVPAPTGDERVLSVAKAIHASEGDGFWPFDPVPTMARERARMLMYLRYARAAIGAGAMRAVPAPTDDEREALAKVMYEAEWRTRRWDDLPDDLKAVRRVDADFVLAAGYRKGAVPAPVPVLSDEQIDKLAAAYLDVPEDRYDVIVFERARHRARIAIRRVLRALSAVPSASEETQP